MPSARTHYRTCNLCEAMCGLELQIEGQRVTKIRGDVRDPLSKGHICPKALALKDLHEDPDRVRTPLRKNASGEFEPVSWARALDEIADRIHALQANKGRDAVGVYMGNPNVHNLGAMLYGPNFLRGLRTKNRYSATSADQLPAMLAAYLMFGHQLLLPIPDLARTEELLIVGANPLASNGSLMSAGDVRAQLKGIQARGGRVSVIDPRRTLTARLADEHDFIRPGTDALFLLAMLNAGLETQGPQLGHLAHHTRGLAAVRAAIEAFTPEAAATHTGISAERIRELADRQWAKGPSMVYARFGACVQTFGGLALWAVNLINLLSGSFDREGGVMFTEPAIDLVNAPRGMGAGRGSFGRWKTRVRGLPEFGGELPVACLAEEIATPGEGQIRGLITIAGNPVLSTPNGRKLDAALDGLDLMVSVDMYVNATTRHADFILPPSSQLERSHYDLVFNVLAVRNVARWSEPALEAPAGTRHDWQILQALHRRLLARKGAPMAERTRAAVLERLGPDRLLDIALRVGRRNHPNPQVRRLSLKVLRATPHGLDLGPLRSCMPQRLPAHQKEIDLAPQAYLDDLPRLAASLCDAGGETLPSDPARRHPALTMISRRDIRSNNSWMHNVESLVRGPSRCELQIHPSDARAREIEDGQEVNVQSGVGELTIRAVHSDDVMPGVVCMPHGWGHHLKGIRMRVAQAHAGVSVNDITDEGRLDELSGVAALTGQQVHVSPLSAA